MKTMLKRKPREQTYFLSLILILLIFLSAEARADLITYDFGRITNNASENIASQLSLTVDDIGLTDQVAFTFYNNVGIASNITEVYFDDGALFGIASVTNNGATFDILNALNPANPPSANTLIPPFVTTAGFGVDSDVGAGGGSDGVNLATDWVRIVFNLDSGKEFSDVITALNVGFDPLSNGDYDWNNNWVWDEDSLRIAIHVRSIGAEALSDTFVLVPVPGAVLLGMLGLGVAGLKLRKFA